ncbi:nicotinamide-nucleotide amidase [Vibrio salinus]|uniref:nicotinamide-nucleotide amidase n=1 Tax=Vibrio salinus TaxID=2899784 RepID=UPI001E2F1D44|nr:nicotinamide-nucleotide amidase [Vibrio salinus]MCE0494207.1 nicotinamide-nucleotide amidase [Vibrio salinus]
MDNDTTNLSAQVGQCLKKSNHILCTAESCTGGGIAAAITDIAGSSAWFDRAFITYSNEAKKEMLGVRDNTLDSYGAVSEQTVREMTDGALKRSRASVAVAVSGIAGPDGGTDDKPVGTVWFSWQDKYGWKKSERLVFQGDRAQVRQQTVLHVLKVLHYRYS